MHAERAAPSLAFSDLFVSFAAQIRRERAGSFEGQMVYVLDNTKVLIALGASWVMELGFVGGGYGDE